MILFPILVACCATAPTALQDAPALSESKFTFTRGRVALALRDLDGDGAADLVRVDEAGVGVRFLRDGRYAAEDDAHLAWPAPRVAWDLTDLEGDGRFEIAMIVDGAQVRAWSPGAGDSGDADAGHSGDRGFGEGRLLLEAQSYLPAGVSRMDFARDVDGDGRADLVLPESGRYRIHLQGPDGWAEPLVVAFDPAIRYSLGDPESLTATFGQSVSLPWFTARDMDGDGRVDLVSEVADEVLFHLARPDLPAQPTWRLDLAALRDQLPDKRDFDFDDLLSNIPQRVEWRIADLDGEAPHDLVLMLGSTFKVYRGGAANGPVGTPQILKSSGNVLYFFVRHVQGDPLPELQIARGERISLGRVLRYLVLPGKIDFDLFTYENVKGVFSRKPTKRATLSLKIPRLLTLVNNEELEAELEVQFEIPARRIAFDPDGLENDVVDLLDGHLVIFRDCAPDPEQAKGRNFEGDDFDDLIESLVLRDLDELEDGDTQTIDLGDIDSWATTIGAELRASCEGEEPRLRHPLIPESEDDSLFLRDLDGDGRSDFVVVENRAKEIYVTFLVRGGR